MKMIRLVLLCSLVSFGFGAGNVRAQEEEASPPPESSPLPPPQFSAGALTTETYSEGLVDIVLPLFFDGANLLFINPRASFTDRSEEEYNIGLGARRLIDGDQAVIGANVFYDRRESRQGASFNQIGLGIEYLSHFLDARANVYLPLNDKRLVNEFSVADQSVARSVTTTEQAEWEAPVAEGHSIVQDFDVMRSTTTRTVTTTTTRHFRQHEVALRGWDAEVGVRLPIEAIEDYIRLKTFAGFVKYHGRHGVEDIDTFRARLELHVKPAFFVDAVYYSDDALTGGNYSLGAYVSVPFDLSRLSQGRNPFAGATGLWQGGVARDDMLYRITELVKRDPQIRTRISEAVEDESASTTSTERRVRTKEEVVTSDTAELATDITFVNAESGDDANPGTFEQPKATVQGGVNDPRSMVFVFDTGGPYNEVVTMTENVILRGSGCPLEGQGGLLFGSGVHPVVDGGGIGPTIIMAANTTVQGFDIRNTAGGMPAGPGIVSLTGDNLTIACNLIQQTTDGIDIQTTGDVNVNLVGNQFFNNTGNNVLIDGVGNSGSFFVNASQNTFTGGTSGMILNGSDYDAAMVILNDLMVTGADLGIIAGISASDLALMSLTGLMINNNNGPGIQASAVSADGAALILAGQPEEFGSLFGGVVLPAELETLLAQSGPIQVNNNMGTGLNLMASGSLLAGVGLFDFQANENAGFGANINANSWNGIALGLMGSSRNLLEIAQLGGDLLGGFLPIDPSAITPTGVGYAQANDNAEGINLSVTGEAAAVGLVAGLEANRNLSGLGLASLISSPGVSASVIGRVEVNDNAIGILNSVNGGLALSLILDAHAERNSGFGLDQQVAGDIAGIGLIASTDPLRALADGLSASLALDPPLTVPGTPFGPNRFSDNDAFGFQQMVFGEQLALGAAFDIVATNNMAFGGSMRVDSDLGLALGLAGSSDNYIELLDLVAGIGLPLVGLPALDGLPTAEMGPSIFSDNGAYGLGVEVAGSFLALNAILGVEANRNAASSGIISRTEADTIAVSLLGRAQANSNAVMGIEQWVGGTAAIGLMLDVHANDNDVFGADFQVLGDEVGVGLVASTDVLRSFIDNVNAELALDPPLPDLPGAPFGHLSFSGNEVHGLNATITGDQLAIGLFTDLVANDNGVYGVNVDVFSVMGTAVALLGSSDGLLDAGLPLLSGFVGIGPTNVSLAPGIFQANNNEGGGIRLNLGASTEAIALLAGLEAVGNVTNGGPGTGAQVDLIGDEALLLVKDVNLSDNDGQGLLANVSADMDDAIILISGLQAAGNNSVGVRINADSGNDLYFVMVDTELAGNGLQGARVNADADGDALFMLSGVTATDNARHGVWIEAESSDEIVAYVGADYAGFLAPELGFAPADLIDWLGAGGASTFSQNGFDDVNPGARAGLRMDLIAESDILVAVTGAVMNANTGRGLHVNAESQNGPVAVNLLNNVASGNSVGILVDTFAVVTAVNAVGNLVATNSNNGFRVAAVGERLDVFGANNRIINNGNHGVVIDASGVTTHDINFGDDAAGTAGNNAIFGSGGRDFRFVGTGTALAQNNWWGINPPAAAQFQGGVNYTPWLTTDPNP